MALALPFVIALATTVSSLPTPVSAQTDAHSTELPGEFFEAETGVDRRGERLAFLTSDGSVHALDWVGCEVRVESVATDCGPYLPGEVSSLRWADVTGDGLLESVLGASRQSPLGPERCRVLARDAGGWSARDAVPRLALPPSELNLHDLFAGGRQLGIRPFSRPSRDEQRSQVTDTATGRVVGRLEGLVHHIRDVDGDGVEDVLTWADGDREALALLRLYVVRGKRFDCVWEQPVEYGDEVGRTGPYIECADLDGDGGAELYVFEPRARRVRSWRWD